MSVLALPFFPPNCTRYEVLGEIGSGAYGVVVRCVDRLTGEEVAIKKVQSFLSDLVDAKRILREAVILSELPSHANIVSLRAIEGGGPGFASEGLLLPAPGAARGAAGAAATPAGAEPWRSLTDVYFIFSLMATDLHKVTYSTQPLSMRHLRASGRLGGGPPHAAERAYPSLTLAPRNPPQSTFARSCSTRSPFFTAAASSTAT
jgi:hypothetical protein